MFSYGDKFRIRKYLTRFLSWVFFGIFCVIFEEKLPICLTSKQVNFLWVKYLCLYALIIGIDFIQTRQYLQFRFWSRLWFPLIWMLNIYRVMERASNKLSHTIVEFHKLLKNFILDTSFDELKIDLNNSMRFPGQQSWLLTTCYICDLITPTMHGQLYLEDFLEKTYLSKFFIFWLHNNYWKHNHGEL